MSLCLSVFSQTKQQLSQTSLFDSTKHPHDTLTHLAVPPVKKDSAVVVKKKEVHDPRKATIRSAILPGWGQAYNKEYWKIPIVYGALSIPVITFVFNNTWYKRTRDAYTILINQDSAHYGDIYGDLARYDTRTLQNARNQYRRDRDYSVLWFLILWGVNVVDATVFGHLKHFDVSDDLNVQVNPTFNNVTKSPGLSFVVNFKEKTPRKQINDW